MYQLLWPVQRASLVKEKEEKEWDELQTRGCTTRGSKGASWQRKRGTEEEAEEV